MRVLPISRQANSSQQVQVAIDYLDAHSEAVEAEYAQIMARIQAGNPPDVQERLRANREKVNARLNRQLATRN